MTFQVGEEERAYPIYSSGFSPADPSHGPGTRRSQNHYCGEPGDALCFRGIEF